MSNMSYCRFHNTLSDLDDCVDDIERRVQGEGCDEDGDPMNPLSESEADKAVQLILKASDLIQFVMDEMSCEADEIDHTMVKQFIDQLQRDSERAMEERTAVEEGPAQVGDYIICDGKPVRVCGATASEFEGGYLVTYRMADGRILDNRSVTIDDVKLESEVGVVRS